MKVVKALLLISIVAALLVSVSLAAEQGNRPARTGGPGGMGGAGARMGMMGGMNPARMVVMMRDQLNLTDEQVTKLEALKPADPNAVQKAQTELMDTQRALRTAVMADDTAKIKELCKKIGEATEKTALFQAQEYKQIKQILTADQYKELQQMASRPMGGGMGGRMGGAGGPGAGGPGGPGGGNPPTRPNTGGGNQ
jgi:Spy/CpxP family protein refolding chaperone